MVSGVDTSTRRTYRRDDNSGGVRGATRDTGSREPAALDETATTNSGRPLFRASREMSTNTAARFNADSHAGFRALQLHQSVPQSVPQAQTTGGSPPTRAELDAAMSTANQTGDMNALNDVDQFRRSLSPAMQAEYDRRLQTLRDEVRTDQNPDGRVNFTYARGAKKDAAVEDLVLRGIVAADFGDQGLTEKALAKAAQGDSKALDIKISGSNDLNWILPGKVIGNAHTDGDMTLSREGFLNSVTGGYNTATHELNHLTTLGGKPESNYGGFGILPNGATEEQVTEFESLFNAYRPSEQSKKDTSHHWVEAQQAFRLRPQELQQQSPDLYNWMVEYTGFDPIAQQLK